MCGVRHCIYYFLCLSCSMSIFATNVCLLSDICHVFIMHCPAGIICVYSRETSEQDLLFKYGPWTHHVQCKEGMCYFCWLGNNCTDCCVEPWRSVVKVEPWNTIRACPNLQLQIVWNWLGVLVLFGRHSAIWSIYLLSTTKVSGNTKRGS